MNTHSGQVPVYVWPLNCANSDCTLKKAKPLCVSVLESVKVLLNAVKHETIYIL